MVEVAARDSSEGLLQWLEKGEIDQFAKIPGTNITMRELLGLDKLMQSHKGMTLKLETEINAINETIKSLENDLDRVFENNRDDDDVDIDTERRRHIEDELDKAREQKAVKYKMLIREKQEFGSQIQEIREGWCYLLDKELPLRERIRNLFRKQGVTIVSVLTAIGMTISTLVLGIVNAVTGGKTV